MLSKRSAAKLTAVALFVLVQAGVPAGRAASGAEPTIRLYTADGQLEVAGLVVNADGWHVRTPEGVAVRIAPELIVRAEISVPREGAEALVVMRDGREFTASAAFFRGAGRSLPAKWRFRPGKMGYTVALDAEDVARVEAGVPPQEAPGPDVPETAEAVKPGTGPEDPVVMRFEADIDYGARICIRDRGVTILQGKPTGWRTSMGPVRNVSYEFERPLPARAGRYYLGDLAIDAGAEWSVRQPAEDNDFTCSVQVQDFADGYHRLSFVLREFIEPSPRPALPDAPESVFSERRVTFLVPADVIWWDTGWEVAPEADLRIWATGTWQVFRQKRLSEAGPAGLPGMTSVNTLVRHMRLGGLAARAGGDSFYVGPFVRRTVGGGGRLFLAQNGLKSEIKRSKGQIEVTVQAVMRRR